MKSRTHRSRSLALLLAALLTLVLTGTSGAWAQDGKAMTVNDLVAAANQVITTVTLEEAKALAGKPGVVIVDVREADELSKGKLAKAIHIPRGLLEFKAAGELPDKDAKILVYCKVGGRGALATETLMKMGYKNAVNMKGGWDAWIAAGYPAK